MSGGAGHVIRTHHAVDPRWSGHPIQLDDDRARVELETIPEMAADEHGLVHGGFVFSLADYAAMLAVNEATVVLVAAEVRFLRPVRVGAHAAATARVVERSGRRRQVEVEVTVETEVVCTGVFDCVTLERHVLARAAGEDE